jgi:effector-binding domain-containing protein
MKQKRGLLVMLSVVAIVLCSVFALCIDGASQEKASAKEEVTKMTREVRQADPGCIIGQPRIQKVKGFHYIYTEKKHVKESEVGKTAYLIGQVNDACKQIFGDAIPGTYIDVFLNLPKEDENMYDVQKGYAIAGGVTPLGEAKVRYVEPALCASILVWGSIDDIPKSYGPLLEFVEEKGLKCADEGWREWHIYYDGENSNNVYLVQHVVEEE